MHHTGKKESKEEILKKEKKIKFKKNLLQGNSNPVPQNQFELKVNIPVHWMTWVNDDNSSLKEVYIPSLW